MKNNLQIQLLDIRVTKKKDAELITGLSWKEAKEAEQMSLFNNNEMPWKLTGQNYLHAWRTHEDFLEIIEQFENIRLCSTHVIPHERRCGKCFTDND